MKGIVLVVDGRRESRERLAHAVDAAGALAITTASAQEALRQLGATGSRPSVILIDARTVADAAVLIEASETTPLAAHVPLVVVGATRAEGAAIPAHVHLTPGRTSDRELVTTLFRLIDGPPELPDARLARGTGGVPTSAIAGPLDLHAYAEAKLVQYLGERRGVALLELVLRDLRIERIETTTELHRVAVALRSRGSVEAAVAALLSGRATLIDSDRTLRS